MCRYRCSNICRNAPMQSPQHLKKRCNVLLVLSSCTERTQSEVSNIGSYASRLVCPTDGFQLNTVTTRTQKWHQTLVDFTSFHQFERKMGAIAKGIPRGCQGFFTPVSLGYQLSVFNQNSTFKERGTVSIRSG